MSKIYQTIHEINRIDTLSSRDQWMNHIHPLVKLGLTVFFIVIAVSFQKYDLIGLLGLGIYLIAGFILAELSIKECIKRVKVVLALVCVVGIANPFFDRIPVTILGIHTTTGVISMLTLMVKGVFAVLASYLLIATTKVEQICYALRKLHVPKIIVTQILLTYRYITVLLGEVNKITQAYALRAPGQKGIHFKVWGTLTGQLLLRSVDRANAVYESMLLRGYSGEFAYVGQEKKLKLSDVIYGIFWMGFIIICRKVPIIFLAGGLL